MCEGGGGVVGLSIITLSTVSDVASFFYNMVIMFPQQIISLQYYGFEAEVVI